MSADVAMAEPERRLANEDLARARWYAFFSRWLLAAPDQQAIECFVPAPAGGSAAADLSVADPAASSSLAGAWNAFAAAVHSVPLASIRDAYDATFVSVGQAPVGLHASVHLSGFANERPLADVRAWLAGLGIASREGGLVTEDHLGLLSEVMAWLIIERPADEAAQRDLFQRWIGPVVDAFAAQLDAAPGADVYRPLGRLFSAFCAVERQAFDMDH